MEIKKRQKLERFKWYGYIRDFKLKSPWNGVVARLQLYGNEDEPKNVQSFNGKFTML